MITRKYIHLIAALAILPHITALGAEPDSTRQAERQEGPGIAIKFAPLALTLDFYTCAMAGVHYQVKDQVYFQHEFGVVLPTFYDNIDFRDMRGIRNRFEIRNYFQPRRSSFPYTSMELVYNNISYGRERQVPVSISGRGMVDYYQLLTYRVRKQVVAFHFKFGIDQELFDRFLLDLYVGLGARTVFLNSKGAPSNDLFDELILFRNYDNGQFLRPSASLGFKLGYVIMPKRLKAQN